MITTNNPEALGWKHNHEQGIRCKKNEQGNFDVTAWPESLPFLTQSDVDTWEIEHTNHLQIEDKNKLIEAARQKALRKVQNEQLEKRLTEPNPPQEVIDWNNARKP